MLLSFISSELYSLMERSCDAWCIKNIDGKVVYINNVYRKLISPSREVVLPPWR